MRRRDTLRRVAGAATVGGLGFLAGCSGGGDDEEEAGATDLTVNSFDYAESDSGELVVTVTVQNGGDAEGSGTIYVTVETDDDITRESRKATVPAAETVTFDVDVPFDYETFRDRGSISVDLR